ncbi:response regulator transcription factor [Saccharibacillus sacchari]|uniref:response regulator transcription factor n=1 Tax=Saccharibacillus sacchari TaxID=456493 RepID=UPI0004B18354|nr:response regulator transcription factor [Saccharibacillus sacchari]
MTVRRILIIDNEQRIRELLRRLLEEENYSIKETASGSEGLTNGLNERYDLILLNPLLPDQDGFDVCRELRKFKHTPILMISSRAQEKDRIRGFEAGADDYVSKPFSPRELLHRIRVILDRTRHRKELQALPDKRIKLPQFVIEENHRVSNGKERVILTQKEYDLLYYLAENPNRVFSRDHLLRCVWKHEFVGDIRTVDTHVKRIRTKLGTLSSEAMSVIKTVWGVGYRFEIVE